MAAYTGLVSISNNEWTALNASEVDNILFQNRSLVSLEVLATATNVAPANLDEGIIYGTEQGENMTLADIFKGIAGPKYLWAISRTGAGSVWVSHA